MSDRDGDPRHGERYRQRRCSACENERRRASANNLVHAEGVQGHGAGYQQQREARCSHVRAKQQRQPLVERRQLVGE